MGREKDRAEETEGGQGAPGIALPSFLTRGPLAPPMPADSREAAEPAVVLPSFLQPGVDRTANLAGAPAPGGAPQPDREGNAAEAEGAEPERQPHEAVRSGADAAPEKAMRGQAPDTVGTPGADADQAGQWQAAGVDAGDGAPAEDAGAAGAVPQETEGAAGAVAAVPQEAKGTAGAADAPPQEAAGAAVAAAAIRSGASVAEPPAEPAARPRSHVAPPLPARRRLGWHLSLRAVLMVCLLPVILIVITPFLLVGQEVTAPSWIAGRVEAQAAALGGGSLEFGSITATIGADLHPHIRLRDARLTGPDGREIARVPEISVLVSPRGLILRREVLVQEVTLSGAQLTLARNREGRVALSFGAGNAALSEAQGLGGLMASLDAFLSLPALEALERVHAENLVIAYQDARAERSWLVDGGDIVLALEGGATQLTADFALLSGRASLATLQLGYLRPEGVAEASYSARFEGIEARDVATQSPALSWLGLIDAPLSADLSGTLGSDGALGPLEAALRIGQGALRPEAAGQGIAFAGAEAQMVYDPATQAIHFPQIVLDSDWGAFSMSGDALLHDVAGGWPQGFVGQIRLDRPRLNPAGLWPVPLDLAEAHAAFRLRVAPFRLEIAEFGLTDAADGAARLTGSAEVGLEDGGLRLDLDAAIPALSVARLVEIWPPGWKEKTRNWLDTRIAAGGLSAISAGLRLRPGAAPAAEMTARFSGAAFTPVRALPPVESGAGALRFDGQELFVLLEAGAMAAPQGGRLDLAGTVFHIPQVNMREAPAEVLLRAEGAITAALSLLDMPPFGFISRAGQSVTMADGTARAEGRLSMPLKQGLGPGEVLYDVSATLAGFESRTLLPGRVLRGQGMTLHADNAGMEISGPVRVGTVPFSVEWRSFFGADAAPAVLEADTVLSADFIDEFGLGLPPGMITGSGPGHLSLTLPRGGAPRFALTSGLAGLRLSVPQLSWSKGAAAEGELVVEGTLGPVPQVSRLTLAAPGLSAEGAVQMGEGGFERLRLDRLRVGSWLDAQVDLVGRGRGMAPAVEIRGGSFDLGRASFGSGGGEGGPMRVALDRLRLSEGLALTGFTGTFGPDLSGNFRALVNGGIAIDGATVRQAGGIAVRIVSDDAGRVLRDSGLFERGRGGSFDITLMPAGAGGSYDGTLAIENIRVQDAPALASLLDAISVVGLMAQLDGQGLLFSNVDASFRLTPTQVVVTQSSAVGPGLGISLDGFYTFAGKVMDFQGVISPLYILNGIGSVLTRPGEGLIGFNFTLNGPLGDVRVGVNPLSALTPGMFRDIFRRPPPQVGDE